ncbi:hypothetical protein B0H67DRAFT_565760 [Lasiosphaeris hirsuta]|uniref:Uncharacterized protein n=1 Tax=Lasiosphaeris hirsuta TaxID=260670 RepID=A0AA40BCK1_9PEZI|nr:hypothetical protein B0H67DRAFT_565760 [Lasiosphaeris hirsuta]
MRYKNRWVRLCLGALGKYILLMGSWAIEPWDAQNVRRSQECDAIPDRQAHRDSPLWEVGGCGTDPGPSVGAMRSGVPRRVLLPVPMLVLAAGGAMERVPRSGCNPQRSRVTCAVPPGFANEWSSSGRPGRLYPRQGAC